MKELWAPVSHFIQIECCTTSLAFPRPSKTRHADTLLLHPRLAVAQVAETTAHTG